MILSVSQVETFDPAQEGGCPRRWYFERVEGHRPEPRAAQADGEAGHAVLAHYFRTGALPKGRLKLKRAVQGAIAAGHLPTPTKDMLVESRFDGQPQRGPDGQWTPLRQDTTLWLGGVPWDGFVDVRWYRDGTVTVLDHKFSSDIRARAKPADALIRTIQMPAYAIDSLRIWPTAAKVNLVHHYVSRRGVDSFIRSQTVSAGQVLERRMEIERLVAQIKRVALAPSQEEVPFNRAACNAFTGCPHQSRCNAFRRNQVNLSPEELAIFDAIEPEKAAEVAARAEETGDVTEAQELLRMSDADDIPPPKASTPAPQKADPVCAECGTTLNAENGSERDGKWKHIGCPATEAVKCASCPHPAHPGAPCSAKRGRGTCQCGRTGEERPERPPLGPVPLFLDCTAPSCMAQKMFPGGGEDRARAAGWSLDPVLCPLHVVAAQESDPRTVYPANVPIPDASRQGGLHAFIPPLTGTLRVEIDVSQRVVELIEKLTALVRKP